MDGGGAAPLRCGLQSGPLRGAWRIEFIATFQKNDYNTIKALVLHNASTLTMSSLITMNTYLSSQITNDEGAAGVGDGFNQSYYFMRAGIDYKRRNGALTVPILTHILYPQAKSGIKI